MIKLIKTTGEEIDLTGKKFTLQLAQGLVGGYIEAKKLGKTKKYLIMNEEGKLKDLPRNETASALFQKYYGNEDFIVGDVIVTDEMK